MRYTGGFWIGGPRGRRLFAAAVAIIIVGAMACSLSSVIWEPLPERVKQDELAELVLETTDRSQPTLTFWNPCGGYVFNEDVQYYWTTTLGADHGKVIDLYTGEDNFGPSLVEKIEAKKVPYIFSLGEHPYVSQELADYIDTAYRQKGMCHYERI